jgi:carboxypeptidase PM20D1
MRKFLCVIVLVLLAIVGTVLFRAMRFTPSEQIYSPAPGLKLDETTLANHLGGALRIKTISTQDPSQFDGAAFLAFHDYLAATFPKVHERLKREVVNGYSLLYEWKGSDPSLKPIMLIAHQDVVPVAPDSEASWTHPGFSGEVADGFIWGRGALDDKSNLMGILESVEALLNEGFQPKRTVYLGFGYDEEVGGSQGAPKIVELLKSRGVHVEFVIDEGNCIVKGIIPGVSKPIAVIGLGEKGYLSLELTVDGGGGHSAAPPKNTAIGVLARAITRIEDHPFPSNLAYASDFFQCVGPEMPFTNRAVFANLWLTSPIVKAIFKGNPAMNAGIRTTAAVTICSGGVKENVLPSRASAVVNLRVMPGETAESAQARIAKIVNDGRVKISTLGRADNPSRVSRTDSASYKTISKTISETVSEPTIIAPFLVLGASDSRHYEVIADDVYRFAPFVNDTEDLKRFHNVNERIALSNYAGMVQFYARLIKNSDDMGSGAGSK